MPKNSELTETERGKILGLRIGGSSIRKISKILKIPKSTVHKNIQRHEDAVSLKSASRSGRPRALKLMIKKS
jgi:IS30 family transposase